YDNYDAFTYGWLVQCVTSLLEWIGLYKPAPKVAYERLHDELAFFRPAPVQDPIDHVADEAQALGVR
ncbi:MAG TPA: hypothetical protein DDY37_01405, partial [Legionella sp.]|nr:hypothetical protein [Legionella sp.]